MFPSQGYPSKSSYDSQGGRDEVEEEEAEGPWGTGASVCRCGECLQSTNVRQGGGWKTMSTLIFCPLYLLAFFHQHRTSLDSLAASSSRGTQFWPVKYKHGSRNLLYFPVEK